MVARNVISTLVLLVLFNPAVSLAETPGKDVDAVTAAGDKVVLHPNGRWEYVDAAKAQAAKDVAQQYPENQGCPPGWRGGLFGIGRCIPPTDPDFSKGSHIGK